MKKAIIVAAGRGRRLGHETDDIPKCMVKVGGRPILHWQLRALTSAGVDDLLLVRGYLGSRIDGGAHRLRFVENPDWANNNILASLMCAGAELDTGFYFSYSDIVFAPRVVAQLAAEADRADIALVVDRRWRDAYEGRTEHPVDEGEVARVERGLVTRVGKRSLPAEEAAGEFIGLAHVSPRGAAALRAVWERALRDGGLEAPFGLAPNLRQAYLTDALNALADAGTPLAAVLIDGGWREIDTGQDLASAGRVVAEWS